MGHTNIPFNVLRTTQIRFTYTVSVHVWERELHQKYPHAITWKQMTFTFVRGLLSLMA
jgi:hypothetical protein